MSLRLVERFICRVPMWYRALFPGATWRIPAKSGKSIYLTFDDGPIPEVTPWVLDTLDELGVKATFFCVADNVCRYPELFAEIQRRGHQVGNHTFHHLQGLKVRTQNYLRDVKAADELINSRFFRPPHGHMRFMQTILLSNHYDIIMWDVITRDYNKRLSPDQVFGSVRRYARNGSIITFHDSLKAISNMQVAMPRAVRWLLDEGYVFKRLGDPAE